MDRTDQDESTPATPAKRAAAFFVHVFTAFGAGVALLALLEAVHEHWAAMFWWLGAALIIDAIDGPMARRLDVARLQPDWSGDVLDLVVDFTTYVFVPAYAIMTSGLLPPLAAPLLGVAIAVTGALYFADRRMKSERQSLSWLSGSVEPGGLLHVPASTRPVDRKPRSGVLIVATFVPVHVIHPVRVVAAAMADLDACRGLGRAGHLHADARFRRRDPCHGRPLCDCRLYRCQRRSDPSCEVSEAMIELLTSPEAWAALLTLTALEIVLGIDNVIFPLGHRVSYPGAAGDTRPPDRAGARVGVPHRPAQPAGLADRADRGRSSP